MQKASATVIWNSNTKQLIHLTIDHKGNLITLVRSDEPCKYKYDNLQGIYKSVLSLAKENNFYFGKYPAFGVMWYDIQLIDACNPSTVEKYGYKG